MIGRLPHSQALSLDGCLWFPRGPVTVTYRGHNGDNAQIDLRHFVDVRDAQRARRMYEPHPKHGKIPTDGVVGTQMDLSDEEAQGVLDNCVSMPDENRVCTRFRRQIYVFHPHRAELNLYHGFPMAEEEVKRKMPELYELLGVLD